MLVNQGVKPEEGDLALSAVPCKEDNPEECALNSWHLEVLAFFSFISVLMM